MYIETEKIKQLFLSLISIDSPSGHEKEVSEFIKNKLKELNVEHKEDDYGNIIAYVSGIGKSLMLSAHMDTVDPGRNISAIVKGDLIESEKDTILGADDKAGITEILCSIEYLKVNSIVHRPLEIIFTREEETGLFGSANLNRKYIGSHEGIVIDRSGPVQSVVIAAPFIYTLDIEIIGKAAHAGSPEKGLNAIKLASNAIAKLKIGRIDDDLTCNIGIISGGDARNAVAERVQIMAEVRSHVKMKAEKQIVKMKKIFEKEIEKEEGNLKFVSNFVCDGYKHSSEKPFIKKISAVWKQMGHDVILEKAGGASDANQFARWGMDVVDIGYGGINPHTTKEQIKISDMQLVCEFIINFVTKI